GRRRRNERSGHRRAAGARSVRPGRCGPSGARAACAASASFRWPSFRDWRGAGPRAPRGPRRGGGCGPAGGWGGAARGGGGGPPPGGGAGPRAGAGLPASRDRLFGYGPQDANPRWFQPHDGAALDPLAISSEHLLLFGVERRGVRTVDALTGRERWSFLPARTRRLHLAVSGVTVLAASESGVPTGLDMHDGTVRFRVAAPLPFTGPPIASGPAV